MVKDLGLLMKLDGAFPYLNLSNTNHNSFFVVVNYCAMNMSGAVPSSKDLVF